MVFLSPNILETVARYKLKLGRLIYIKRRLNQDETCYTSRLPKTFDGRLDSIHNLVQSHSTRFNPAFFSSLMKLGIPNLVNTEKVTDRVTSTNYSVY